MYKNKVYTLLIGLFAISATTWGAEAATTNDTQQAQSQQAKKDAKKVDPKKKNVQKGSTQKAEIKDVNTGSFTILNEDDASKDNLNQPASQNGNESLADINADNNKGGSDHDENDEDIVDQDQGGIGTGETFGNYSKFGKYSNNDYEPITLSQAVNQKTLIEVNNENNKKGKLSEGGIWTKHKKKILGVIALVIVGGGIAAFKSRKNKEEDEDVEDI